MNEVIDIQKRGHPANPRDETLADGEINPGAPERSETNCKTSNE